MATLSKIKAATAAELCTQFQLEDEAKPLLRDDLTPAQFLELLIQQQQYRDAVRLLAHGLPKREAVWWACLCARSVLGAEPDPKLVSAIELAEQWVYKPSEENRRQTHPASEAAGFDAPAGWAAMAAFWSGGSLAPADCPEVPPAEDLTGKAVAGAVMLAAVLTEPERADEKYQRYLEQGIDVAGGGTGRN